MTVPPIATTHDWDRSGTGMSTCRKCGCLRRLGAVVERYAEPGVSMYLDPPYHPSTRKTFGKDAYEHELSAADHDRLLATSLGAVAAGARVAISGYACDEYDEALAAWRRVEFRGFVNSTTHGGRGERTEVLWMSYGAEHELARAAQLELGGELGSFLGDAEAKAGARAWHRPMDPR